MTLWIAGGAQRPDALGQVVVRLTAVAVLIAMILFGPRPSLDTARPVALLLAAAIALVLLQLVPLPPAIWQSLPGRAMFAQAATLSGQPQPWRPWAIVPGATVNAAGSLLVPVAMLVLVIGSTDADRRWLPGLVLSMIAASMFVGLLQFSGSNLDNPFINESVGQVSGTFANRNHFALFLALGCLLAPTWAFLGGRRPGWRAPVALGLVLLFVLSILASGSRAGIALGLVALLLGLFMVWRDVRRALRRYPRWVLPAFVAGVFVVLLFFVALSISADRAISIHRVLADDAMQDKRSLALPTVLEMVRTYFPAGSGFGGFDPVFRIHEPFDLLMLTYFNQAHNDVLAVVLEGGLPGLLLLLVALLWCGIASVRAWQAEAGAALPKLGSAMLFVMLIASVVDYPARTPTIMAMIVVSALWLSGGARRGGERALPDGDVPI